MMSASSSKALVRSLFFGKSVERMPFMPWVSTYAAKLEQITIKKMFTDTTLLTRAVQNVHQLFRCDGVVPIFDLTLEAEACGCTIVWAGDHELPSVASHSLVGGNPIEDADIDHIESRGRLPIVLEATKRLALTLGRDTAMVAVVTGLFTLASHLWGRRATSAIEEAPQEADLVLKHAGRIITKMSRLYCECNVDIVVLSDEMLSEAKPNLISKAARYLQPTWNVIRYYNASSIVLTKGNLDLTRWQAICALGGDAVVLTPSPGQLSTLEVGWLRCLGVAIPLSTLTGESTDIIDWAEKLRLESLPVWPFLTTEWDIPLHTSVEKVHELAHACHRLSQSNGFHCEH